VFFGLVQPPGEKPSVRARRIGSYNDDVGGQHGTTGLTLDSGMSTLAHEVGALGVAVNSLSPGPVRGPRMERNFAREAARTAPSGRPAHPRTG